MSGEKDPLPPEDELAVDSLCLRFEAEWRQGKSPRVDAYLQEVKSSLRSRVARELQLLHREFLTSQTGSLKEIAGPQTMPAGVPTSIGEYQITRKIGEGGMGSVYEAMQENPRRTVAVKVIRSGNQDARRLRRFRREAHALGQLHHPGVAQIFEARTGEALFENGAKETISYFVMELVRGKTLKDHVDLHNLTLRERLVLVKRICDGVQHAHEKGVIHRDLKPANILIEQETTETGSGHRVGRPKILDFGVARIVDVDLQTLGEETTLGGLVGTVPYMSPEQVSGGDEPLDTRSDIYSLGVILHELLTGRLPYEVTGQTMLEAVRIIREEEPRRLSLSDPAYQGDIETIVGKTLEKDPNRRYGSALELALDIQRYLDDEPILARPPSTMYQLGKFARRNRGLVSGIGMAFGFLILGLLGVFWFAISESRQRSVAQSLAISEGKLRRKAQQAEEEARSEERKARAVNDFLMRMIREANPVENAMGRDLTLLEALNQVVLYSDAFGDQPEVAAEVHLTAGSALLELGDYEASENHLRRALDFQLKRLGSDHLDTAEAYSALGRWYQEKGDYGTAHSHLARALEIRERSLGKHHPTVGKSLNNLAALLEIKGNLDEAEAFHRRALTIRRDHPGKAHRDLAISLNNLGVLLENRGRYDEARESYKEALLLRRQHQGDDHPGVATTLNNVATLSQKLGEHDEAAELFLEALTLRRQVLGESHPLTVSSLNNLGATLLRLGEFVEAEPMLKEALKASKGVLPPAEIAAVETNLATLLWRRGYFAESLTLFQSALGRQKEALGRDHLKVAVSLLNLGTLLREINQADKAVQHHLEAVRIREKVYGRAHIETQKTVYALATSLRMAKQLEQACPLFQEVLQVFPMELGEKATLTEEARLGLLFTLNQLGDFKEAEPLAQGIVERKVGPRYVHHAIEVLININRRQGRREEVRYWRAKLGGQN